jgi:hypothetical protein
MAARFLVVMASPLSQEDGRRALELVDSKTFGTGVVYLAYRLPGS